jgi:hypothetical protein
VGVALEEEDVLEEEEVLEEAEVEAEVGGKILCWGVLERSLRKIEY